jgi:hypothetical protein
MPVAQFKKIYEEKYCHFSQIARKKATRLLEPMGRLPTRYLLDGCYRKSVPREF